MEFVSLKSIVYDLLNLIRNGQPVDDEPISEKQIEAWVHHYRSLFIKRDLDKGKKPNPDYIQNINNISLVFDSDKSIYKTSIDIPKSIDFNYKSGITFIGDKYGNQIQLIPEKRAKWQTYNKWTQDETTAYLNNSRLYIYNSKGLTSIYIRGIFENPVEAAEANGDTYNYDSVYPIPMDLIPGLKREILKAELGIILETPNDDSNNSDGNILINNG
jgi:hypothetical protein